MTVDAALLEMETELIKNICRFLGEGNMTKVDWQVKKLSQLGALNEKNRDTLIKQLAKVQTATSDEILGNLAVHLKDVDKAFFTAGFAEASAVADRTIQELIEAYGRSLAGTINTTGQNMLTFSQQIYTDTVIQANRKVLAGISTPQDALKETISKWTAKGIPALIDDAGRQWQVDSYINMQVRTATRSATTELTMERSKQYGNDLIEIDSHQGARPGCEPFQGRIFSLSGNSDDYPPLASTTYGDADGIFGINCRHNMYPFFPELSERTYKPVPEKENDRIYKESQRQRQLETRIRSSKREIAGLRAAGLDTSRAMKTYDNRQTAMQDFIQETGRTRRESLKESVF